MSLIEKALRQLEKDKQTVSYGAHPGMPPPVAAEEVYEIADDAPAEFFNEEHEEPRLGKRRLIAVVVVVLGLGAAAGWYLQQGGQQAPSPAAPALKLKAVPVTVAPANGSVPAKETGVSQQAQKDENSSGARSINQKQPMAAVAQPEVLLPPASPAVQEDADRLKSKRIPPAPAKHLPQDAPAMQQPASRTLPAVPTAGAAQKQRSAKTPRPDVTARAANLLQSDAGNADSLNNQGVLLLEQGAAAQARDYFEKALKLAPDHEKALNNMGLSLYAQGRTAEALNYYERAVKVNPGNIETCVNRGIALRSRKDFTQAAEVFQKALTLNPAHPETLYNYGLLLKDMGQQEKSRICFERFLKTAPPHLQGVADSVRMYLQASTVKKQQ